MNVGFNSASFKGHVNIANHNS